jgi:hypothetical protein
MEPTFFMFDSAVESDDIAPLICPHADISAFSVVICDCSWVIGAFIFVSTVAICVLMAEELSELTDVMTHP